LNSLDGWWLAWLIVFIFLCQRAFRISTSLMQRSVLVITAVTYILCTLTWLAPDPVFSGWDHTLLLSGSHTWFVLQPALLAWLTIQLDRRSGLILWWWNWVWPVALVILLLLGLFISKFFLR